MQTLVRFITAAAAIQLLLLPQVSASSVSDARVTIEPSDLVLAKTGAKLIFVFTPTATLPSGGTITIQYSSGFYSNGITPTMVSCSVPLLSSSFALTDGTNRIVITTLGPSIVFGSVFTITIGGLAVGSVSTRSNFDVCTSTDLQCMRVPDFYVSGTRASQFSMAIANADRSFGNAAAVTIAFTPSSQIALNGGISLFFPAGLFKNAPCSVNTYSPLFKTGDNCPFTYKSSTSNAYLRTVGGSCTGNLCFQMISNGVQVTSPTGGVMHAGSLVTITIFGAILGPPAGSVPQSVFVITSGDVVASTAVDSGYIGLGSYVNGSCPYGMTWSNALQACSTCSVVWSDSGSSTKVQNLICGDFQECLSCTPCPFSQAVSTSGLPESFNAGPPATYLYYGCSNSSTIRCPAGSGKKGDANSGCSPCPFDQYNDGNFDVCQNCPSGTYPSYSMMMASVYVSQSQRGSGSAGVMQGNVMQRSATSCSPKCPVGTGVYGSASVALGGLWGAFSSSKSGKGCFPCLNWEIVKDNTCQACNAGGYDRATLNTMGNKFVFANQCIPDICPWPYVVSTQYLTNINLTPDTPPKYSMLPSSVCGSIVHFGGTVATITVIAIILLGTYAISISFAATGQDEALTDTRRRKLVVGMLLTTFSPAIDFVSDLMYIVSTLFYNSTICIVCCFCFLLPMFFFWRMLVKHGVHFDYYIGKPPAFAVMEKYDSIPKALLGFVGYAPLYIINLPISLPLFLVGHVLYCCKVFPVSRVSNLWLRLYTRSDKHTSSVVIIIPLLQESIFEEMLTESLPQMIIQIVNNTLNNVWSPLSYFSTSMSGLMILNGIWRLVYYRIYLKINIDAIPTDLSNDVFKFSSIEEGELSLGKFFPNKAAPELELNTIVSEVCSPASSIPTYSAMERSANAAADGRKRRMFAPDPAPYHRECCRAKGGGCGSEAGVEGGGCCSEERHARTEPAVAAHGSATDRTHLPRRRILISCVTPTCNIKYMLLQRLCWREALHVAANHHYYHHYHHHHHHHHHHLNHHHSHYCPE
jgi:hypothetical protein